MAISVQVQMSPGCGHGQQTLALVRDVLSRLAPDAAVEVIDVQSIEDAHRLGFHGSPTVVVDGEDVEPRPPAGVGLG
jgi:hypothetical protein